MRSFLTRFLSVTAWLLLSQYTAHATDIQDTSAAQKVEIDTLKRADEKSYRRIVKGMDVFEQKHALAPLAPLRFQIRPREPGSDLSGLQMKIRGDDFSLPVELDSNLSFSLPRDERALAQNAALTSNRKADTFAWHPDIRTPGLPPDTRRLGDLRLQCEIEITIGNLSHGDGDSGAPLLLNVLPNLCHFKSLRMFFIADRPLFNVSLHDGTRRESLISDFMYGEEIPGFMVGLMDFKSQLDHVYSITLGDKSWSDNTLVEFDYMDDEPQAATQLSGLN
jgi:hypothetical protein